MTHTAGWMPLAAEMHLLYTQVGRDQQLLASRDLEDGAVIADTAHQEPGGLAGNAADAFDQLSFRQRQNRLTISEKPPL
jgi:hypothetical protein